MWGPHAIGGWLGGTIWNCCVTSTPCRKRAGTATAIASTDKQKEIPALGFGPAVKVACAYPIPVFETQRFRL